MSQPEKKTVVSATVYGEGPGRYIVVEAKGVESPYGAVRSRFDIHEGHLWFRVENATSELLGALDAHFETEREEG